MRKQRFWMSFSLLLLGLAVSPQVRADVLCHADVGYTWIKEGDKEAAPVTLRTAEAFGPEEEITKQDLGEALLRERPRAMAACRERHENLSGCVTARFSASQSVLATLGFSARKALEDAIKSDCVALQGRCGEPKIGEVTCVQRIAPVVESPAASGGKDGKEKDAKAEPKEEKKKK